MHQELLEIHIIITVLGINMLNIKTALYYDISLYYILVLPVVEEFVISPSTYLHQGLVS